MIPDPTLPRTFVAMDSTSGAVVKEESRGGAEGLRPTPAQVDLGSGQGHFGHDCSM